MNEVHVGHTPRGNYKIWCQDCQDFWGDYTSKLTLGQLFQAADAHYQLRHERNATP